jgi:hypothetical protein
MKFTNKHNAPRMLVNLATRNARPKRTERIGVTDLIGPPRIRELTRRHYDEIEQDVTDALKAMLGTAVHKLLEDGADPDAGLFAEVEMSRVVRVPEGQLEVRGVCDVRDVSRGTIEDWKTTSVFAFLLGTKQEWISQQNVYAWMDDHPEPVRSLWIHAILNDWSMYQHKREPDRIPPSSWMRVEVPLWPAERQEAYVRERVSLHLRAQKASEEDLPLCTDEERWQRPTKYGVRKDRQAKQALPGTSTESRQLAEESLRKARAKYPQAYIHEVTGEAVRCANYCPVSAWCNQYQATLAA